VNNLDMQEHLLIVGSGPLERALKNQVTNEGLPVRFTGFLNQTDIPAAYAAADCLVLPSDYSETWGLVVNEAMA
jgi:glycosyltransferase involved in cell wall biosynthesis